MSSLDLEKLKIEYKEGVNQRAPIIPRRYTFIESEASEEFSLTVGPEFFYNKLNDRQRVVLGEWLIVDDEIQFYVYIHEEEGFQPHMEDNLTDSRWILIDLTLRAIRFGDNEFFGAHPEMRDNPIVVYILNHKPEYNRAECCGSFSEYEQMENDDNRVIIINSMEHNVLIDEKIGDINGDGIPDRISIYGDKTPGSELIHNIIIKIRYGESEMGVDSITELHGYNPTLFLGDFTKDGLYDILYQMDPMFNSLDSNDKGGYGAGIYTIKENLFEMVFESHWYNTQYRFHAEYHDKYKISILNVKLNKLFFLDISYMGEDYLSQYYDNEGKLFKPMLARVSGLEAIIPVIGSEKDNYYDILGVHHIVGASENDILGHIKHLMRWNGKGYETVWMKASYQGIT